MTHRSRSGESFEPIETASRDEIAALQLERMKWSLEHAYAHVPHYRAKFDAAGVHPDELQTLADLARFPFTTKEDLRQNYPFGMFAVPHDQIVRVHASSGTTGKPTVVGYTQHDLATWSTVMARSIFAAGGRPGHKIHVGFGYGLFTGGLGAHYGVERLGAMVIPMSGGNTERQVQLICDFTPDVIMCTPSYALNIADEFVRQGLDPAQTALTVGLFGAEPWTDAMRNEIEARFGIDAIDLYGLSEIIGPGVACECADTKDGPTVWEDHFYPEIIDPDSGVVLPDGSWGELVFTSLTKEALPVVRYRTRDLSCLLPGTARSMRRMARITGRTDDMLIIRGVNVFPSQIEEQVLKVKNLAPHYQLEVAREHNLDHLTVKVELVEGETGTPAAREAAQELGHHIKSIVGVSAEILVMARGQVPRSEGKAVRVIDRRKLKPA